MENTKFKEGSLILINFFEVINTILHDLSEKKSSVKETPTKMQLQPNQVPYTR